MYRLYVDEVGTDDLVNVIKDKHRYLSLSGVAMKLDHSRDVLTPNMDWIKANVFDQDVDDPINLHRKDIMGYKGPFEILRNPEKKELFDKAIIRLFSSTEYSLITALIDKNWMLRQDHWERKHPYHFLMEIMVEKYTQFLERKKDIGDIMPESRQKKDRFLQSAFDEVYSTGTYYVPKSRMHSAIRAKSLKFRTKKDNIAGIQLCDLVAHPSHMYTRKLMGHEVELGPFSIRVTDILRADKYDRSSRDGTIKGYGIKHLP